MPPASPRSLSPQSLAFGNQLHGTTSAAQTITVENYGNATLTIASITTVAPFLISANTCGSSLAAGATCTVSVEFSPTATGAAAADVIFIDNAGDGSQEVALTGTGT